MTKKEINFILIINLGLILIPINTYVFSNRFTAFELIGTTLLSLFFYNGLWFNGFFIKKLKGF